MIVESSLTETRRFVRAARQQGRSVGCIPTMGALHRGHVSLIEIARKECDFVVATIFVNPTQFGPEEDFTRYPRTLDTDLEMCRAAGADLIFTPPVSAMYTASAQTIVRVTELAEVLEGIPSTWTLRWRVHGRRKTVQCHGTRSRILWPEGFSATVDHSADGR